ncbi:MAG: hypothetical protein DMD28_07680 [Gemmatimonadetes bacterium]|nr:MAG: hypothetical protein DMD28_07680 [Gemmatimonadota bacterium]
MRSTTARNHAACSLLPPLQHPPRSPPAASRSGSTSSGVSGGELFLLLVIALLVLGAHRLPEAGRLVGKGLRDFQRALNEARHAVEEGQEQPRTSEGARPRRLID